jgi:poly(A) polymerase
MEAFLPKREESSAERERALRLLQALVDAWVPRRGATLLHFGSYRLDVHDASSDIDTVCVVPHAVPRSTLFSAFVPLLRAHAEVADVRALPDAFVPVVKFTLAGVSIDFLCAQRGRSWSASSPAAAVDAAWLRSSVCLAGMDIDSVRSLNGSRVAARIVALVPKLAPFRLALRAVRCWAKARGLYSNVLGYLGGINWALLVARVCQDHPDAEAPELTRRFFAIYAKWNWAATAVHLCPVEHAYARELAHLKVWGGDASDTSRAMKLVTPSFPAMVSVLLCTVTFYANLAHSLTRSP